MTKSEQSAVSRAIRHAKVAPDLAAATLAILHRSARTQRSQREIQQVLDNECLSQYLVRANGALVPRIA